MPPTSSERYWVISAFRRTARCAASAAAAIDPRSLPGQSSLIGRIRAACGPVCPQGNDGHVAGGVFGVARREFLLTGGLYASLYEAPERRRVQRGGGSESDRGGYVNL